MIFIIIIFSNLQLIYIFCKKLKSIAFFDSTCNFIPNKCKLLFNSLFNNILILI